MSPWPSGFSRQAAAVEPNRTPHASFRLKPEATPRKLTGTEAESRVSEAGGGRHTISWSRRALWVVLALVPSALLLGVTQHLATDVVSAPLLWVVPLALYLTTFIAAFPARDLELRDSAAAP